MRGFPVFDHKFFHFPRVNTVWKKVWKKTFIFYAKGPPDAESTRSKFKISKNEMNIGAGTLCGVFRYLIIKFFDFSLNGLKSLILIEIGKSEVVPAYVKRLRAKIVKIQAQLPENPA